MSFKVSALIDSRASFKGLFTFLGATIVSQVLFLLSLNVLKADNLGKHWWCAIRVATVVQLHQVFTGSFHTEA